MSEAELYVVEVDLDGRARSFFSVLPPGEDGLPSEAIVGEALDGPERVTAERFAPNPVFVAFLQRVIAENGPRSPEVAAAAQRQPNGSLPLVDRRAQAGAAAAPEDVIGVFAVEKGRFKGYRPSAAYRLLTARGFFALDPWLHDRLLEALAKL